MTAQAQLSVSTGATRAIDAPDGEVPITATGFPGLVTALANAELFDSPEAGRLRYTGVLASRFSVQATVSADIDGAAVNVEVRLAKNGVALDSGVQVTLAAVLGTQPVSVQSPVDLALNDYLEVLIEASGAANLTIRDLSFLVLATAVSPATGLISDADLKSFAPFIPAGADVSHDLAAARAMMAQHLDASGLDASLLYQIELRLAAHFAALRYPDGRRTSEQEGDARASYGGRYEMGLQGTLYGQAAIGLDPTGLLESLGTARAELRFL